MKNINTALKHNNLDYSMAPNRNVVQLRSMILVNLTVCILVLAVLISGSTSFQEIPLYKKQNTHFTIENVSSSCHDFTSLFYKNLLHCNHNENIATSPVNLHILLSLLANGASGTTLDELKSVLHHKDIDSLNEEFKTLIFSLNNIEGIDLLTTGGIFLPDGYPCYLQFAELCWNVFNTSTRYLFEKQYVSDIILKTIIREIINKKISHMILSDVNEDTTMVLLRIIYFKGKWFKKFDTQYTQERTFHVSESERVFVSTMFMNAKLNYGTIPQWKASFIEIPYTNPDIVMVILLPDKEVKLRTVENHFNWKTLANTPRSMEVIDLYLPKFSIKSTANLKTVLSQIGLNAMFSIDDADFSRISENPIHVDNLLQTIILEVDEEGTETLSGKEGTGIKSARRTRLFDVNRPFLFAIEYKPYKIPLFLGCVRKLYHLKREAKETEL